MLLGGWCWLIGAVAFLLGGPAFSPDPTPAQTPCAGALVCGGPAAVCCRIARSGPMVPGWDLGRVGLLAWLCLLLAGTLAPHGTQASTSCIAGCKRNRSKSWQWCMEGSVGASDPDGDPYQWNGASRRQCGRACPLFTHG